MRVYAPSVVAARQQASTVAVACSRVSKRRCSEDCMVGDATAMARVADRLVCQVKIAGLKLVLCERERL